MSKKRIKKIARSKKLNQKQRLASAKSWVNKYNDKNIVRGYRKHFGTDSLGAALELKKLGIPIEQSYIDQLRISVENTTKIKLEKKKLEMAESELNDYSDEQFCFIAGYTSNGAPLWNHLGRNGFEAI